jgi:hypothetical protein
VLERVQADVGINLKCVTAVLSNDTNAVARSLAECSALVTAEAANDLNNLSELLLGEEAGAKMLNHVVKDEDAKLLALLVIRCECSWEHGVLQSSNELANELTVSLEEDSHKFSSGELEVKLVVVLFLDHGVVLVVKVFIVLFLLSGPVFVGLVVFSNSLKRLGDDSDSLLTKVANFFSREEALSTFIDDVLESIDLSNQAVGLSLLLHGFVQVGRKGTSHVVQVGIDTVDLLDDSDETWQTLST